MGGALVKLGGGGYFQKPPKIPTFQGVSPAPATYNWPTISHIWSYQPHLGRRSEKQTRRDPLPNRRARESVPD